MKNRLAAKIQRAVLALVLLSSISVPAIKATEQQAVIEAAEFFGIEINNGPMRKKAPNIQRIKWCQFCDRMILLLKDDPRYSNACALLRKLRTLNLWWIRKELLLTKIETYPFPPVIKTAFNQFSRAELEAIIQASL